MLHSRKYLKLFRPVFTLLVVSACYHISYAQKDSLRTSQTLKEVVVTGERKTLEFSSLSPLQLLKGEELQRINGLSVADAIRYFSGAQLKDYGGVGGLKTINVRSMGTNHTAVFYDGVQLGNAQNGQVDLGKYALDNLEEIALYQGQKSEILQPAASFAAASSVFLQTKTPVFKDGKRLNTTLQLKSGSFGLINPSALLQYKINDKLSANLNTGYTYANGRYKFRYTNGVYDTTAVRSNGDVTAYRLETGLYGKLKNEGNWNVKFYLYDAERGLPGAIVSERFDYHQRMWDRNMFVQAAITHHITNKYSIMLNAKFADDDLRYLDPEITNTDGFLENKYHENEWYFSVANRYQLTKFWDVALSADYRYNTMKANLHLFPYPDRHTTLVALATQWKFSRFHLQMNALSTSVADQVKEGAKPGNKQEITPAIMASWQPFASPDFKWRAFYKSIFRLPTFNDLYFTQIGNRFLKPEYAEQYNTGFVYSKIYPDKVLNNIELRADAYYNKIKNKIIAQPGKTIGLWSMSNLGLVDIRGVDVNIKSGWRIFNQAYLHSGLTYTYQKAVDITNKSDADYKAQIPYIPVHSGTLLLGLDYKKTGANYSFIYTGERYNQSANNIYNYVEPWYTHDFSVFYKTRWHKNELKITAEINNLLNQYYDVIANFPMPGRNYRFTLSCKI